MNSTDVQPSPADRYVDLFSALEAANKSIPIVWKYAVAEASELSAEIEKLREMSDALGEEPSAVTTLVEI